MGVYAINDDDAYVAYTFLYTRMLSCHTDRATDSTETSEAAHTQWQPYSAADIEAAQASTSGRSNDAPSDLSNTFTNFVTQTYARSSLLVHFQPVALVPDNSNNIHDTAARLACHADGVLLQQLCLLQHERLTMPLPILLHQVLPGNSKCALVMSV